MLETFKRIWSFSEKRHKSLIKALLLSFLRSVFGITQILAIIITVNVLTGNAEPKSSIIKIIGLTLVCIVGNFLTSYSEQTSTLETGFFIKDILV